MTHTENKKHTSQIPKTNTRNTNTFQIDNKHKTKPHNILETKTNITNITTRKPNTLKHKRRKPET